MLFITLAGLDLYAAAGENKTKGAGEDASGRAENRTPLGRMNVYLGGILFYGLGLGGVAGSAGEGGEGVGGAEKNGLELRHGWLHR